MKKTQASIQTNIHRISTLLVHMGFTCLAETRKIWRRTEGGLVQTVYIEAPIIGTSRPVDAPESQDSAKTSAGAGLPLFGQVGVVIRTLDKWAAEHQRKLLTPTHYTINGLEVLRNQIKEMFIRHAQSLFLAAADGNKAVKIGALQVDAATAASIMQKLRPSYSSDDLIYLWKGLCGPEFFQSHPDIEVVLVADPGSSSKIAAIRSDVEKTPAAN